MAFLPDDPLGESDPTAYYNRRISAITNHDGFIRIRYRPDLQDEYSEEDNANYNVIILPTAMHEFSDDPRNQEVTEADSPGRQHPITLSELMLRIDLRAREDPMSVEALTLLDTTFIDEIFIDKGGTGFGKLIQEMYRGPFGRNSPATEHIRDSVTFIGGYVADANVALPDRFNPAA